MGGKLVAAVGPIVLVFFQVVPAVYNPVAHFRVARVMHANERATHIESSLATILAIHAGDDHAERTQLVGTAKGFLAAYPLCRFRSRTISESASERKYEQKTEVSNAIHS
ncbi:hypothetical protein D3C87_1698740 [compost metagenome]